MIEKKEQIELSEQYQALGKKRTREEMEGEEDDVSMASSKKMKVEIPPTSSQ